MFPPRKGREDHATVRLRDASEMIDALTEAGEAEAPRKAKLKSLLARLGGVVGADLDFHVLLLGDLDRQPAPLVLDRVTHGGTFDLIEPRPAAEVQELLDFCGPICDQTIPIALGALRTPTTYIYSEDADSKWYERVFRPKLLEPNGWEDDMACYWAGSPGHVIIFNAFRRRESRPYTKGQRDLLSLACRAIAPLLHQSLFDAGSIPEELSGLREELVPVLLCVLQGFSRPEIAAHAGVAPGHVDHAFSLLFEAFDVRSRGELMARFVDGRIQRWLEQAVTTQEQSRRS